MKRLGKGGGLIMILLLLAACSGGGSGGGGGSSGLTATDRAAIQGLLDTFAKGLVEKDAAKAASIALPPQRPQLEELVRRGFTNAEYHEAYFSGVSISGAGASATAEVVWNYTYTDLMIQPGLKESCSGPQRWTFGKVDGKWYATETPVNTGSPTCVTLNDV